MAVKGPNGRDPLLEVYDVPPSVEKGLPLSSHHAVSTCQGQAETVGCLGVCTGVLTSVFRARGGGQAETGSRPGFCSSLDH